MKNSYQFERNINGIVVDYEISEGGMLNGGAWQDVEKVSTVQNFSIGTKLRIGNRVFHYAKFHTAVDELTYALVNGNVIPTDGAEVATDGLGVVCSHTLTVLDTTAAGSRPVNYYQGGYCLIYRNPALAQSATNHDQFRQILASTVGNTTSITLTLDYPLTCVPAATVDCYPSIYSRVGKSGHFSSGNEYFVGYAHAFHAAGGFGWIQTWGPGHGHYVGGGTEWPGNHGPNDRTVVFSIEGGLRTTKSSGTVVALASQIAGDLLPCTAADYGSCFVFLKIAD